MFPYDQHIAAATRNTPATIADVLALMQDIDATCQTTDGLKWFNGLYMAVTDAVKRQWETQPPQDGAWRRELDVQFAALYFNALHLELSGGELGGAAAPECWHTLFAVRTRTNIARIQFALAGMNAHINHDLPMAIVSTCQTANVVPRHGTPQYSDYTNVNSILDGIIEPAKKELNVTLDGNKLPVLNHVSDLVAGWDLAYYREKAWRLAENLWSQSPAERSNTMAHTDWLVAEMNRLFLMPAP